MKKAYKKPEIVFEHLELNQGIASCTWELIAECSDMTPDDEFWDTPVKEVSTIDGVIKNLFSDAVAVCTTKAECYHVPYLDENRRRVQVNLS